MTLDSRRSSVAVAATRLVCAVCGYGAWRANCPCNQCGGLESTILSGMDDGRIDGIEVYPAGMTTCSICGTRVGIGAPSEVCCPAFRDKPAPQWVYDFHEKHGRWPKWEPR